VKPVAHGAFGNNVLGIDRIGFELLSELTNHDTHKFETPFPISLPDRLGQVPMREGLIDVGEEALQNEKLLGSQMGDTAARAPYLIRFHVNGAIVKEDLPWPIAGMRYAAEDSANARQQFP